MLNYAEKEVLHLLIPIIKELYVNEVDVKELKNITLSDINEIFQNKINRLPVSDTNYKETKTRLSICMDIVYRISDLSKELKNGTNNGNNFDAEVLNKYHFDIPADHKINKYVDIDNNYKQLYLVPSIPSEYYQFVDKIFDKYFINKPSSYDIKLVLLTAFRGNYFYTLSERRNFCATSFTEEILNEFKAKANNNIKNAYKICRDICTENDYLIVDLIESYVVLISLYDMEASINSKVYDPDYRVTLVYNFENRFIPMNNNYREEDIDLVMSNYNSGL